MAHGYRFVGVRRARAEITCSSHFRPRPPAPAHLPALQKRREGGRAGEDCTVGLVSGCWPWGRLRTACVGETERTKRPLAHARAHSGNLPRPRPHHLAGWGPLQPLPPAPSVARLGQWVPEVAVFLANESRPPPRRQLTERERGKLTSTFPEGRVPAGSRPSPIFPALANPGTAATGCVGTLDASVSGAWVLSRTWSS